MTKHFPCPLVTNAKQVKDIPALICGDNVISYKELNDLVIHAAACLQAQGIGPKDRIAMLSPNSVEQIIILFAAWRIGTIVCPLSIYSPDENMIHDLNMLQCKLLLTNFDHLIRSEKIKIKKMGFVELFAQKITKRFKRIPAKVNLNQEASIIFTSGSSHQPKAVLHTYGHHYYNALGANAHLPLSKHDCWLLALPLYHVGGLGILFRAVLGQATILIPTMKESLDKMIWRHKVTHVSLVSTQFFRILRDKDAVYGFKTLKAMLLGGSAIPESLLTQAIKFKLPVYLTYGLTEMASQVATSNTIDNKDQFHKAKVLKYRNVKISKSGEILVKGKTLFKGYVEGRKIHRPTQGDGWFATGDLGKMDKAGWLSVLGRKDNMFISGGENIQPEEIEHCICQLEEIEQAIVVPLPNAEFGARPIAFVKTKNNHGLDKTKIITHLEKYLPKFKIPDGIFLWPKELEGRGIKVNRQAAAQIVQHQLPIQGILN